MAQKSLFSKLIKCSICGKSYVRVVESSNIYICGGYKKSLCDGNRRVIKESDLLFLIEAKYPNHENTNEYMKSIIDFITVDSDSNVFIYYKDGDNAYVQNGHIKRL